eukprot:s489_g16.t1
MQPGVSLNSLDVDGLLEGLACAAPSLAGFEDGVSIFRLLADRCDTMSRIGRAMAWVLFRFPELAMGGMVEKPACQMILGRPTTGFAVHRGHVSRHRPLFPLPLGDVTFVKQLAERAALDSFESPDLCGATDSDVWTALSVLGLNGAAGHGRAELQRKPTEIQRAAVASIRQSTTRVLPKEVLLTRPASEAEKELATRFLSYTGEEVPKMQVLKVGAAVGALPPSSHGGAIDVRSLVSDGTKWFLEHPEESLIPNVPAGSKLQAKVHIQAGEALQFCKLLVERNVCTWIPDEDVLVVNNQQVLNGLFAVGKGTFIDGDVELQRTIMNLIPSNTVLRQAEGGTCDLPSICQYLSLVLQQDESMAYFQSDMSSAFYLFRIPGVWSRMLAFNLGFWGSDIGLREDIFYRPACAVLPMGWSSAVSIMQEVANRLTTIGRLPPENKVRRLAPLPPWLTSVVDKAHALGKPWFHVYLDNFCAMEKGPQGFTPQAGEALHGLLEESWSRAGVLSSSKKRVSGAQTAQELGAYFDGKEGTLGPSSERLLKLIQTTMVALGKRRLKRKWIQVVAGRWIHCMSFRRPLMICLDHTWNYIAGKRIGEFSEACVRGELFGCCTLALLLHTNLKAQISDTTTASDASMSGGAVGMSRSLTLSGSQFALMDLRNKSGGKPIPVLLLSLFNGVGCSFRCYDLVGVSPQFCISYEINPAGNRVTSRRWPHVRLEKDVRDLTIEVMRSWRYLYPEIQEIHVWGGFPCVGLSSVRAGRLNLDDPQSGLFYELVRIIKQLRQVFGFNFPILYAAENVASMDVSAEQEITKTLNVKPLRLDPAGVVPIHRPRYCWTNSCLSDMDGVEVREKDRYYVAVERLAPVLEGVSSEYDLDEAVSEWIQLEFEDGTPLHLIGRVRSFRSDPVTLWLTPTVGFYRSLAAKVE